MHDNFGIGRWRTFNFQTEKDSFPAFFAKPAMAKNLRQVAANVLFFEPLEDCAGMAASFEILAQSVLPSLFSAFATQSMIHFRDWVLVLSETVFFFLFPSQETET